MSNRVEHLAEGITLHLGDCREIILPSLGKVDAVVTDPPYGMNWNTNSSRFSGGHMESVARRGQGRSDWGEIAADDKPFDPSPWLAYPRRCLAPARHVHREAEACEAGNALLVTAER